MPWSAGETKSAACGPHSNGAPRVPRPFHCTVLAALSPSIPTTAKCLAPPWERSRARAATDLRIRRQSQQMGDDWSAGPCMELCHFGLDIGIRQGDALVLPQMLRP